VPYALCEGNPTTVAGVNTIALKRAEFKENQIADIKRAFRTLFFSKRTFETAVEEIKPLAEQSEEVRHVLQFIQSGKRGITTRT